MRLGAALHGPARALTSARRLDRGWGADRAEGTGKHHLLRGYAGTGAIEAAMHTIFDPPEDNAPAGPAGPAGPPGPPGNAAMAAAAAAAADGMAVDACT